MLLAVGKLLKYTTRNMPLRPVNLDDFAARIHGFVGADIKSLCQEAAYEALRRSLPGLEDTEQQLSEDFLEALRLNPVTLKALSKTCGRHPGEGSKLICLELVGTILPGFPERSSF